jgi:energy-coupling factor transport system ATP-binding protein
VETYSIRNVSFTYPGGKKPALDGIHLSVNKGELVVLCGKSGCGKTTLLRNLKTVLSPFGQRTGEIYFDGRLLESVDQREQASRIGYVLQNPDNQLVTDKVWHELAFGLENLGVDTKTIRIRVAEMASFFGIQTWFEKNVTELSGGQKQILNLAAVMVMQPDVLVLDEPTSQLDPIAAGEFLDTVRKVNREIGTTVIMTEHRLDEILPLANRAIVMDHGKIIVDDIPANVGAVLAQMEHHMFEGMPAPLQAYAMVYSKGFGRQLPCPVDVGEGRAWLTGLFEETMPQICEIPATEEPNHHGETPMVELSDVWFRYSRDDKDVVKGLSMKVYQGEIFCIVGGNGTGKTTALSLISGLRQPIRGKVRISLESWNQRKTKKRGEGMIGVLPQNAQAIFVGNTIGADLMEVLEGKNLSQEEKSLQVKQVAELVEIDHLMEAHPYDVSGGEQQRAALAKILLLNPKIILLDEPTKGIDNHFKNKLAEILRKCTEKGATVIMVSHDIEFAGKYADRCAMFFDGAISTTNAPRKFFSGNSFYTTASNRMSRHLFRNAVTPKDVAELCIANLSSEEGKPSSGGQGPEATIGSTGSGASHAQPTAPVNENGSNPKPIPSITKNKTFRLSVTALIWICMPLTLYLGMKMPGESGYLVSSLMMIFYIMVPFYLSFEKRKPQAREVVLIAVMIALAVASRAAFFMVPQFKPMLAIIIIAGVCLGAQSGFLVGSMSAFVSNFLFGQGPWTPFQMLAWGLIGFFAGVLVANLLKSKSPVALSIYGFFAVFLLHGGITDLWTLLGMTAQPTLAMALTVYGTGFLFNIILAVATVIFLLLLTRPMIEKIRRVQNKYGLFAYEQRGL